MPSSVRFVPTGRQPRQGPVPHESVRGTAEVLMRSMVCFAASSTAFWQYDAAQYEIPLGLISPMDCQRRDREDVPTRRDREDVPPLDFIPVPLSRFLKPSVFESFFDYFPRFAGSL